MSLCVIGREIKSVCLRESRYKREREREREGGEIGKERDGVCVCTIDYRKKDNV